MNQALWIPNNETKENLEIVKFQKYIEKKFNIIFDDYSKFHQFSVREKEKFWIALIEYFEVSYSGSLTPAIFDESFKTYNWFKNVKLNFAYNLLKNKDESKCALNFVHESGLQEKISYGKLNTLVASLSSFLDQYLSPGDVLGAYMSNIPETVISMLAASSLGAVFTSTSCDFGVTGVIDRFSQVRPKVLVAAIGYEYFGKYFDQTEKLVEIERELDSLEVLIVVDFLNKGVDLSKFKNAILFSSLPVNSKISFRDLNFSDPLYIMYSSGTTGKPKCIVHSQGGTLLQHIKELGLHSDLTKNKKICYFTTCGWMMWNWLMSSLYFGSEIVLYEGSPAHPNPEYFFKIIDREKINIFGTSPKFLKVLEDSKAVVNDDLSTLETILSTGSPLLPEQYDYVYTHIKKNVWLSSISGGTDIIGCFMLGNPGLPVYRGEIQCLGLGMDVASIDANKKDLIDEEGELVCKTTFPSRPISFLNDPDGTKLNEAYFCQNPPYWTHGDFVKITKRGGVIVYGRSDATLNPGGVRIGTAEIYRQTEKLPYIEDSICVGRSIDGDVEIVLFVKMKAGLFLELEHKKEIKTIIKNNTSPRHIPREIYQVKDIPYTRSGKKVEIAITKILAKKEVTNTEALANPEVLAEYYQYS